MNAFTAPRFHWTAEQIADAVPLRLSELALFDAARDADALHAANSQRRRARTDGYLPADAQAARFRIS